MADRRASSLGGVAFGVLLVLAFLLLGGDTPDYGADDAAWVRFAADAEDGSRIAVVLIVLAAVAFLAFAGELHRALGGGPPATSAVAAGVLGMAGIVIGMVLTALASVHGAQSDPTVTRAVAEASGAGFLLASGGFGALLGAVGRVTLRTPALPRWTAFVALTGAAGFLVTLATLSSDGGDSPFGVGYPIGFLCLAIWSIATGLRLNAMATEFRRSPLAARDVG